MGIQPLGTSSGSILKLLLFPSFCTGSRKIPFASLFYMIFCFISYMYIKPQGKKRQPLWTVCLMQAEMSYHFNHWLHVLQKSSALWFYAHFFHDFINVHSPWAGADKPFGLKFWWQQEASSLWSFVASLKRISSTSDFIHIFSSFNKCI